MGEERGFRKSALWQMVGSSSIIPGVLDRYSLIMGSMTW